MYKKYSINVKAVLSVIPGTKDCSSQHLYLFIISINKSRFSETNLHISTQQCVYHLHTTLIILSDILCKSHHLVDHV